MLLMRSASADVVAVGADGLTIKSTDFHRQATATPADVSASNHDAEVDEDGTDMLHGFDQELIVLAQRRVSPRVVGVTLTQLSSVVSVRKGLETITRSVCYAVRLLPPSLPP
ncbi:hypothetical protein B296_00044739, partial [Ensete ventricosum]